MATFGEILAELRRDRHLTQREFANTIHVSVSTISNYEQGVHFPDIDKLMEIADYFKLRQIICLAVASMIFHPMSSLNCSLTGKQ